VLHHGRQLRGEQQLQQLRMEQGLLNQLLVLAMP
jgi:hypothetical protein